MGFRVEPTWEQKGQAHRCSAGTRLAASSNPQRRFARSEYALHDLPVWPQTARRAQHDAARRARAVVVTDLPAGGPFGLLVVETHTVLGLSGYQQLAASKPGAEAPVSPMSTALVHRRARPFALAMSSTGWLVWLTRARRSVRHFSPPLVNNFERRKDMAHPGDE